MKISLPDAEQLYLQMRTQVQQWLQQQTGAAHLVGITSGGQWLAQRLHADLQLPGAPGVLSSSMHRDDFAQRGLASSSANTSLPFEVNGAAILVLDDVLYTGRTVRAVLNELFDYGRPARVQLMVLADRGGRHLPVCADWAACQVNVPEGVVLELRRDESGHLRFDLQEGK